VGFQSPIAASERTQTQALDRPATGIGFSIIYSFHLAICIMQYLLVESNKSQDNENKLAILAIKSKCMKNNLGPVIDDIVCVLILETPFLPTIYFLGISPFAHIHSRFHALQVHIHNAIPVIR
jgi:hypothetical protein